MSGFGPFRPRAVFPAGWYFDPVRSSLNQSRVASNTRRFPSKGIGARHPNAVFPVGWYFKPVLTKITKGSAVDVRRTPMGRIYSAPFTSSAPPTNEQGSPEG